MKVFCLFIMTMLFAACNHQVANDKTDDLQDSVTISEDESDDLQDSLTISEDDYVGRSGGHVCTSEDGRITIESGMYSDCGTSPDYWAVWTIKDDEGKEYKIENTISPYQDKIHCLYKNDGTVYYIVNCSRKASSTGGYEWIEAFRIVGDTVEQVNVIDGSSPYKEGVDSFLVNYDIPSWYFATMGIGYEWILEYDSRTKELYVPTTTDDNEITDRYKVWRFDGERFNYRGERHNTHLNAGLSQYDQLLKYVETKDYIVRVDKVADGELRYASWRKPKTMADYPDIVLTGGKLIHYDVEPYQLPRCDEYHFKKGNCQYIVNYCEVREDNHEHSDYLMVISRGKVLLKQEIER